MKATNLSIQDLIQTGLGDRLDSFRPSDLDVEALEAMDLSKSTRRGTCDNSDVRLQIASYLHAELPRRYAHRIKELPNQLGKLCV